MTTTNPNIAATPNHAAKPKFFAFNKDRRPQWAYPPPTALPEKAPHESDDVFKARLIKFVAKYIRDTRGCEDFFRDDELEVLKLSAAAKEDIADLNVTLIPEFIIKSDMAKRAQNAYYRYQWAFSILAFLTAMVATLTVSFGSYTISVASYNWLTVQVLSVVTAILGATTAAISQFNNSEKPKTAWYENRRVTEELRKLYFIYLAHLPPFDKNTRYRDLIDKMTDNNKPTLGSAIPAVDFTPNLTDFEPRKPELDEADARALFACYRDDRLTSQKTFYRDRSAEYKYNFKVTFNISIVLTLVAVIFAAINTLVASQLLALLTVALPAFSAMLIAAQRVYDWERQRILYDGALFQLTRVENNFKPPLKAGDNVVRKFQELVQKTEFVLNAESEQWGQLAINTDKNAAHLSSDALVDLLKSAHLSDDALKGIKDIAASGPEDHDGSGN